MKKAFSILASHAALLGLHLGRTPETKDKGVKGAME